MIDDNNATRSDLLSNRSFASLAQKQGPTSISGSPVDPNAAVWGTPSTRTLGQWQALSGHALQLPAAIAAFLAEEDNSLSQTHQDHCAEALEQAYHCHHLEEVLVELSHTPDKGWQAWLSVAPIGGWKPTTAGRPAR